MCKHAGQCQWKEFWDRNLTEGNHSVSAAIKDATSCCSEEADPSAALASAQDFLCMGGQVEMSMCMNLKPRLCVSTLLYDFSS